MQERRVARMRSTSSLHTTPVLGTLTDTLIPRTCSQVQKRHALRRDTVSRQPPQQPHRLDAFQPNQDWPISTRPPDVVALVLSAHTQALPPCAQLSVRHFTRIPTLAHASTRHPEACTSVDSLTGTPASRTLAMRDHKHANTLESALCINPTTPKTKENDQQGRSNGLPRPSWPCRASRWP